MRLAPWLILAGLVAGLWAMAANRPLERRPGVLVADAPRQDALEGARPWVHAGFIVQPRARLTADVRVLGREAYRFDAMAAAVPVDLAVGWGPMSDTAVLERISISQSARFMTWRAREWPIPREEIERHAANWHVLPSSEAVARRIRQVRVGDVVRLEGVLVDLTPPHGEIARTSLRRDDTGAGACEIIWVESVALR